MNVKEIYEHAKLHVDADFPYVHARRWFNEALQQIAMNCATGSVIDSTTIEAKANEWNKLPSNFLFIEMVNNGDTNDFTVNSGRIKFYEDGTYIVDYKRPAKNIYLESDIPEINELYHFPISYWIASREKLRYNPDDQDGLRLESTFYLEIARADTMLSKNKKVRHIKV